MKTKLYILFLLMFSMNISCLKEGPYISLKSKMKRLTANTWVISEYYLDGKDFSEQVSTIDSMKFAMKFSGANNNDHEYFNGKIYYSQIYWDTSIFKTDSAYCKRVFCGHKADFIYILSNRGKDILLEFLGSGYNPNYPWAILRFKFGLAVIDNITQVQKLTLELLRLTSNELILSLYYDGHFHRMVFKPLGNLYLL
jgi:hypothetical protein